MKSLIWTMKLLEDVLKSKRLINPKEDNNFISSDTITFHHGFTFFHMGTEIVHKTRVVQNMNPDTVKKILDLIRKDLNEREIIYKNDIKQLLSEEK